jgi:peptide/nickel transport system substrate-binding protein
MRNADWWGLAKDAHNIDRVEFTAVADPARRVAALLAGEIDFLHDPPFAELDQLASAPGVRLEQTMEFRTIFFGLNQGSPELRSSNVKGRNPFADLRVRQAVYQAIDIDAIRNDIMRGYAIPAGMVIQPGINGYTPELDTRLPNDPAAARSLLAAAGYPDGFEVGLDCPRNRYFNDEAICRAVAGMLAKVGIPSTSRSHPWASTSPSCGSAGPTSTCWGGARRRSVPTIPSSTCTGATARTTRPATLTRASTS